ncbi:Histidine biosynthesis bifunctional protein hisB [Dimargaris verticillata]|uniref:Imidazole glycerol phosphate synthase hisHF n=1 Tax=Dimargaris verticillata TaxID=2761393 RepID=A0A9W8EFL4_9FUNG|nr:Histidine biosynthesis bifunctional protein hisB [Dimargaris verticillata]
MATDNYYLLDYGAGNVRSLVNAVSKLGYTLKTIETASDFEKAEKILFPGVGAFGYAAEALVRKGFVEPLRAYLDSGKPFFGICVGMQVLFEGSDESPDAPGLGYIPGRVRKFSAQDKAVPHMGWNHQTLAKHPAASASNDWSYTIDGRQTYYFVHSYAVPYAALQKDWTLAVTQYDQEQFISAVQLGNILCTQFHPEKSGQAGVNIIKAFLDRPVTVCPPPQALARPTVTPISVPLAHRDGLTTRVIACLDVRANDQGDLVVTKGDQYDVRERNTATNEVRNLGKPVELAKRYYEEGADEITFLNITSFRNVPMHDLPMLEVLRQASQTIFVPLTVGGGIRDVTDPDGKAYPALEVAGEYFRSGADKVSIGSDAVYAAETYWKSSGHLTGRTAIETIAQAYGAQAVVISVDPRRVYVSDPSQTTHHTVQTRFPGPKGEQYCWYQCTVQGGREGRDLDVRQLVVACQALGAGEILLNCMDRDGTNAGYDLELIADVKAAVSIPVIASSGAGRVEHFAQVVQQTGVEATLAAGIFHRREVPIAAVKAHLQQAKISVRTA